MFTVSTQQENEFEIVVLQDAASGTSVEIVPACGAVLHAFKINHQNGILNIIDNYSNKKEFDEQVEMMGFKSCKLSPFACRLKDGRYNFGGKQYTIEKFYLGKHAMHGLIYDAEYDIVKVTADEEKAGVELRYSYKANDAGFPFKYDCRIVYELIKSNELIITTFIKNLETTAIPIMDGWHPYFNFGGRVDDLLLNFKTNETLEFDEELIPTKNTLLYAVFNEMKKIGATKFDDGFVVNPQPDEPVLILKDESKNLQLEIITDKSYPYLQLYIPDNRQSIAIENLSAAPDAFNNQMGLTVLPAGNEAIYKTSYRIRRL